MGSKLRSELFAPDLTPSVQGHTIITVFLVCDWFSYLHYKSSANAKRVTHSHSRTIEIHYQHESSVGKRTLFSAWQYDVMQWLRSFVVAMASLWECEFEGNKSSFQSASSPSLFISYCACVSALHAAFRNGFIINKPHTGYKMYPLSD